MSRADEVKEAVEQAFGVAQMQESAGWAILTEDVDRKLEAMRREILSGRAGDRYAALCGFIEGAEYALKTRERLEEIAEALRGS